MTFPENCIFQVFRTLWESSIDVTGFDGYVDRHDYFRMILRLLSQQEDANALPIDNSSPSNNMFFK